MKKFFLSILLALAGVSSPVLAQEFPLNTNTQTTVPSCLPYVWNASFTGSQYNVFALDGVGTVTSWNCWNANSTFKNRYAIVVLDTFQLNPLCSSLGIDRLRVAESSAATSVFNMLVACGRPPVNSSEDWDKYVRLLTIGQAQPEQQDAVAMKWLGPDYRHPVRVSPAASSP